MILARPDPCLAPCLELLRPAAAGDRDARRAALDRALVPGPRALLAFLRRHRIDQLVFAAVRELGAEERLGEELLGELRGARRAAAVGALVHAAAARRAAEALAAAGVEHVFFKGLQLGEELYGDAALRPSADVDLLVAPAAWAPARAALESAGFGPRPEPGQPPYQLTLAGHGTSLDLHRHLFPPERSRRPLTATVLAGRRERRGLAFPGAGATLLILLLNPALTDHVSQHLLHAVDLDRWLRRADDDAVADGVELLRDTGLRPAAWAMLEWTRALLGTPVPAALERALVPGPLRRRYLRAWLARDPARLYHRFSLLVRAGFGLALHDRPTDALRALRAQLRQRRTRG